MKKTLLHILMHNGRLLERAIEEELASSGLHHGQGRILINIQRTSGITQAALARQMDVKPSTITNMLKPLEQKKLIKRKTDPKTNRAQVVSLTPAGTTACSEIQAAWDRIEARLQKHLPQDGRAGLFQSLETIVTTLGGTLPTTGEAELENKDKATAAITPAK
ncbi:MarR family winged helix-turn-helix transcriptional regulator [Pontiellaceae bacterium B12227]|nr:MarR family winged helix-turn-helix transcriptional regulator [Pontiellaceae bacterium B12227]